MGISKRAFSSSGEEHNVTTQSVSALDPLVLVDAAINCSYDFVRAMDGGADGSLDALLLGTLLNCTTSLPPTADDHTLPENLIEDVYEDMFVTVVGHYVLPFICVFGIVGILLTVIVLSQKNMTTSTNCYLLALSIADLLFLVMLITVWLDLFFEQETQEQYIFEIYAAILTVFMQIFLTASIWLTVMLAVERYIAICLPYLAPKVCRVRRARLIIVGIYVAAFIAHVPIFFEYQIRTEYDEDNDQTITYMDVSEFATSKTYVTVYPWIIDGMLQSILPFLTLLLLNTRLIWELRKSTKYIKRNLHVTGINYAQREELQVTLMLVIVVLVFFVCQAPYVIYTAIVSINHYHIESAEFTQFHVVTKLLLTCKAAANFILYCWFSERFATTLRRLCRRGPTRHCRSCGQWNDSSGVTGNSSGGYYSSVYYRAASTAPLTPTRQESLQLTPSPRQDSFRFTPNRSSPILALDLPEVEAMLTNVVVTAAELYPNGSPSDANEVDNAPLPNGGCHQDNSRHEEHLANGNALTSDEQPHHLNNPHLNSNGAVHNNVEHCLNKQVPLSNGSAAIVPLTNGIAAATLECNGNASCADRKK